MSWFKRLFDKGSPEYRAAVERAMAELRDKTAAVDRMIGLADADWDADMTTGQLTFTSRMVASAPMQVIGTRNAADGTFLWGWDHPSVPSALARTAEVLRQWGQEHDVEQLTTLKVRASEDEAWQFAALACHLTQAQGAYRGVSGSTQVFMTFGTLELRAVADADDTGERIPWPPWEGVGRDIPQGAEAALMMFLAQRHAWEKGLSDVSEKERRAAATKGYAALIAQHCAPTVQSQPPSYGSDPGWAPGRQEILAGDGDESAARVFIRDANSRGYASEYEFHLRREADRWLITSMLYLDEYSGDRLESL